MTRILRSGPWLRLAAALVLTAASVAAMLALMLDAAGWRALSGLATRFGGAETVVVWSHGLETADAAQARAGEVLAAVPGVVRVSPLDPAPGDPLIARLFGAPAGATPRLLQIDAARGGAALAKTLAASLGARGVPALAIDHSWKDSAGARKAGLVAVVGALAPVLALIVFVVACVYEARRELVRGRVAVELMRQAGAGEGYVAALVRARVAGLAFTCTLWGAAGAMAGAALIARLHADRALGGLGREDLITPWPLAIPLLVTIGVVAAWTSARSRLNKS